MSHLRQLMLPVALIALLVLPVLAAPAPHAHAQSCGNAPAPRLTAGETARVTLTDGTGNNLRATSATNATVLGVLPDGEIVSVLSGPQCTEDLYWWQVRRWNGQTGWTVEGDANGYWLEPWPTPAAQVPTGLRPNLPDLKLAFLSGYEGYLVPHVMAADGTDIQPRGNEGAFGTRVVWSPDGSQIAFSNGDIIWVLGQFDALELSQTGEAAYWPTFAPDGRRIAYMQEQTGSGEIMLIDLLASSNPANLTDNPAQDIQPAWSPDGGRIAFVSDRDGSFDVYTINPDGSDLTRVTTTTGDAASPVWSPDGTQIAFTVNEANVARLAVVTPGSQAVIFPEPGAQGIPAWSPDGSRLAYAAETAPDSDQAEVFSIRANGEDRFQYTASGGSVAGVTWSPGGQWISFADDSSGNFDLYAIRPNGTGLARLTENPGIDVYPVFQPPTTPNLPAESSSAAADTTAPTTAPSEDDLLLIYDASVPVFTLQNTSGQALNLSPLTFVGNGRTVPSSIWAPYTASPLGSFKSVGCLMIWGFGLDEQPPPPECGDARQAWITDDDYVFWTAGSFEVRYNDTLLTTCDTAAGRCTVDLP